MLTSRRFCDVCAVENLGHEWMPRLIVISAVLIGLFGFGSYLRSSDSVLPRTLKRADQIDTSSAPETTLKSPKDVPAALSGTGAGGTRTAEQQPPADTGAALPTKEQTQVSGIASENPVYFCGAMTKKGKPCSRRVKTKGRCWQHEGQPSAVAGSTATDVY